MLSHTLRQQISIHALREEGDSVPGRGQALGKRFLSTPSARRATGLLILFTSFKLLFLSTPSARRATDGRGTMSMGFCDFYPRPPRGGRRLMRSDGTEELKFLSTPSARRATISSSDFSPPVMLFLSTPSARRATCVRNLRSSGRHDFYPRPPRGGRPQEQCSSSPSHVFLSTPSARRATGCIRSGWRCRTISIHALREEGDGMAFLSTVPGLRYFYPRPPRGGRRCAQAEINSRS